MPRGEPEVHQLRRGCIRLVLPAMLLLLWLVLVLLWVSRARARIALQDVRSRE